MNGNEEKTKKEPTFFYYAIVKTPEQEFTEVKADKKTELFQKLNSLGDVAVVGLYRGRKVNLQQRIAYKIG